jgi:GTP-binding protein HflX
VEDSLAELALLARTAGLEVVGQITQRLAAPNPATYIGKGKVEELAQLQRELGYDIALFDDELSPGQQRHLEDALGARVVDRTGLILDIFARRAQSHEGRLQVELAQYEYYLPRLTRMWTHLSRQAVGGVGLRGPGETQLESDRRRIRKRISDLRRELEQVRRHRHLYRSRRQGENVPIVALVGYTNAGKSTLLNVLSGAGVFVEDKLFATLDPTTRRIALPNGQKVLLTDTVGFIQKLPTQLVAAFRATLEELREADLLLHILDITHSNAAEQAETVSKVLGELGLGDKPVLTALNKIDKIAAEAQQGLVTPEVLEAIRKVAEPYEDMVAISAEQGTGLEQLLAKIAEVLGREMVDITILLPYSAGELAALFHERGKVEAEEYCKEGTRIRGRLSRRFLPLFQEYVA